MTLAPPLDDDEARQVAARMPITITLPPPPVVTVEAPPATVKIGPRRNEGV